MFILAHRANQQGPHSCKENSVPACHAALEAGFGLETDLRLDSSGSFYISHDPLQNATHEAFGPYEKLFRSWPDRVIAVNVKELGYEEKLIDFHRSGAFGNRAFYFDFELLEPQTPGQAQRKIRSMAHGHDVPLASRLSDRHESLDQCLTIPSDIVWADEFDSLWLTGKHVEQVKNSGRQIYVISPELHNFSRDDMRKRWADFKAWEVDGVCTDYALEALDFFG
jgi:glycerophosphoryl diester phosphodiesterase